MTTPAPDLDGALTALSLASLRQGWQAALGHLLMLAVQDEQHGVPMSVQRFITLVNETQDRMPTSLTEG